VINAFKNERWQFVRKALNEQGYVEKLSGLAEVRALPLLYDLQDAVLIDARSNKLRRKLYLKWT